MYVLCATCTHYPGRGVLCPVAHIHATAHRRRCDHHQRNPFALHVGTLRALAREHHREGAHRRYMLTLGAAHHAAEAVRR